MSYDEFPDPAPVIREWMTRNNRTDGELSLFDRNCREASRGIPHGVMIETWMTIAFAAGRNGIIQGHYRRACRHCSGDRRDELSASRGIGDHRPFAGRNDVLAVLPD